MYMVSVNVTYVCVLCIPAAIVIRTCVLCIRRGQRYLWYPLLLTYVADTEPLRSEMNTLLLFCQASEEKKQCHDVMHLNCLHNEYEKRITKLSVQKNLDGSWWLSRTSISNYIFSFFSFFIQTIVQYLHLQIKSFLITLSTCNICFVSFFKLIVLYISNIQKTILLESYTKGFKLVVVF